MKKIITISGNLGSGKSTIGKILCEYLNYKIISVGDIVREIASKKGMTINEFNEYIKDKPNYDKIIDNQTMEYALENDNIIFVSRMAWNFVKESFKIYLYVNEEIGAKRILKDKIRINEKYLTEQEAIENVHSRFENARNRYIKNYGIDITKKEHYDLYLDTTNLTIEEVTDIIYEKYNEYLNPKIKRKVKNI